MTIEELIRQAFPEGLEYDDAAQLCLALYSHASLPDDLIFQCTKEKLPSLFSELVSAGFICIPETNIAARYGANFHDPKDKGHWTEVIASIFKIGNTVDQEKSQSLAARLQKVEQVFSEDAPSEKPLT